ncbi:MAG: septation protein IspZ [Novosphingobium sp.]
METPEPAASAQPAAPKAPPPKHGLLSLLIEYGPILCFFLIYHHYAPTTKANALGEVFAVIRGTIGFIIAALAALSLSLWKFRRVSPMLVLSTVLIVFFGGLTVWTQDQKWIMHKPTAVYLLFAVLLLGGWLRGKALLKVMLSAAFEGLDDTGWMKLSRNWGFFFVVLAVINEGFAGRTAPDAFEIWLKAKLWLFMPLSFLFTFAHMPMLLRHGLASNAEDDAATTAPHE